MIISAAGPNLFLEHICNFHFRQNVTMLYVLNSARFGFNCILKNLDIQRIDIIVEVWIKILPIFYFLWTENMIWLD
jgi:hypothetical protein